MSKPSIPGTREPDLHKFIGLEFDSIAADEIRAHLPVSPAVFQPFGIVHGGVYATIGEAVASVGGWIANEGKKQVMGISNATSFVRPVSAGVVHAVGKPRHNGRTTGVWDVEMTNDDGKLVATSRVTLAIREIEIPAD